MIRWLLRAALVGLLIVVVLLAALPWLAGPALRVGLEAAGFDAVEFEDVRIGLRGAQVTGLEVGQPPIHRLERLSIDYAPSGLMAGRIERLSIEGLSVRGQLTERGLELVGPAPESAAETDALPPLPRIEHVDVQDASIRLQTPAGELHLPLRAEIEPTDGRVHFALSVERATLATGAGTVDLDVSFEGGFPVTGRLGVDGLAGEGTLAIDAHGLAVEGIGRGISATGTIGLALENGRLVAETDALEVGIDAFVPRLASLAEALPPPWRLRLGTAAGPTRVETALQTDGTLVEVGAPVDLETARPAVKGSIAGTFSLNRDHRPEAVRAAEVRLDVDALRWQGLEVAEGHIDATAEGRWPSLQGSLRIDAQGEVDLGTDVVVEGITLQQDFDYAAAPSTFRLTPQAKGSLRLARFALLDRLEGGPLAIELQPTDAPALQVDRDADGGFRWRQQVVASLPAFDGKLIRNGEAVALSGQAGRLEWELAGDAEALDGGKVVLVDGTLRLPERAMRLEGVSSEVSFDAAGLVGEVPIEVAEIRHGADPAWFRPLAASIHLEPGDERVAFSGRLTGAGGAFVVSASGTHDPARGSGGAQIELAPLVFDPGELQPARLSPLIGAYVEAVGGQVSGDGALFWDPEEFEGQASVLVEDLSFSTGPARLERINGIVRFDQLFPPSTAHAQQLAIGEVDLGLPLTAGLVTFELRPGPALDVEWLRFDWAGGTLRAEPFTVGSDASGFTVVLEAEALDLAEIFEQVRLGDLTGKGTISGSLPVRFEGTEAVIEGGELAAEGPGWLRYRPQDTPAALQAGGQSMELLLQALENFEYESLRITLDGRTDAEMDVGLHIKGANPELYGGHPIEFNLNLEGELANVLRSGLSSYQIPERIRERMQEFRR